MLTIVSGVGLLLLALSAFSLFSLKMPKGQLAMSGMANAAVATFLVEAVHKYISGDLLGIKFFQELGATSGSLGGVAAAILVPISMGANPVLAVVAGVAVGGYGILPGFIAGYVVGFLAPLIEKKLPTGLDIIGGALLIAPIARLIVIFVNPGVDVVLAQIGTTITAATEQSPLVMGLLLGGIMKMICTSPLSSMALTAMLGLDGLAMGIAAIACVGGSFTNGMIFHRLKLGDKSNTLAVMLEPLTQADIITSNPIPIYASNFFGGGLSGMAAAGLGIINNAPGTASPIPGLLAPFAFNPPVKVLIAIGLAVLGGLLAGFVGSLVFKNYKKPADRTAAHHDVPMDHAGVA
ncbi:fructose-specific phosphotransferase system IIC component [Aequitasia blattaphilus]|uniref:PTS sugar transporter subunit IIC n=1 Tax=Aequitasia blattaphilus TaxID=2949332 RepID=A0ABT1EB79_9FIRM|nr:PTS sugar transporter subunit IIC [Aequitasia blattaphilus]MCP1101767.1 PTS sugar transporter subunit IIC [Aequitasia blattaphilus]MCR8614407.1 PTS sugar transporter subunit IIC [Aequitasia blattaphilus]